MNREKNKKEISVFINARVSSTRCKNKMLRPFSDSTLIDICLSKLHQLKDFGIYFGAYETELLEKARAYNFIKVVPRSYESAHSSNDGKKIFEILNHIQSKWVVWINPCTPFLEMKTVLDAIESFKQLDCNSMTSVKEMHGWFYSIDGKPLTNVNNKIATQDSDFLLEVAHAFHIYEREFMLKNGRPWNNKESDPQPFTIPFEQSYDIDTEEQFIMVEALYNRINQ